ncbi:hypothetical protein KSP40_PGU013892 [Platanthera guangdongensis]|uniref:Uncharacterized protein n=1 Tax=Platanthera guangdongensis TaxID=2320717 RepID=A0ABR2MSJ2_9ASPA
MPACSCFRHGFPIHGASSGASLQPPRIQSFLIWLRKLVPGCACTVLRLTVGEREEISLPISSLDDSRRSWE